MSYQDHLRTCSDCQKRQAKPTIRVKGASSYRKERKLAELASVIRGVSYPTISYTGTKTKAASSISWVEKSQKLKELGRMIRGV
jgi:hypothetical protein